MEKKRRYSCRDYREEMRLLGLKRRLSQKGLSNEERRAIVEEIQRLESVMEMD